MLPLLLLCCAPPPITVKDRPGYLEVETDALVAQINRSGYVSGVAAGSLLDKKTGARDLGFGLHIMDFLMAPGWRDDGYSRDPFLHGHGPEAKGKAGVPAGSRFFDLSKHYVEGPQICTKAKELKPEVIEGKDYLAVKLRFTFTEPAKGLKAGSTWEQTLVFRSGLRYVITSERITSVNDVKDLFYRIDMPGHIKHKGGDAFHRVYLSYLDDPIPAKEFKDDFAPDARYLYQRDAKKLPERMIRAYQVKVGGKPGPWLAGMTLDPAAASEAWCHQRGYVCMIQELHRKDVKAGESFGAAYLVGWFDSVNDMQEAYDAHKGATRVVLGKDGPRLK